MGNIERGEVSFEVEGAGYVLRYDFNAFCELEDLFGQPIMEILQVFNSDNAKFGFREMRKFIMAGLTSSNGEVDLKKCGELIHAVGFTEVQNLILQAIEASFPKTTDGVKKKKVEVGIGPTS